MSWQIDNFLTCREVICARFFDSRPALYDFLAVQTYLGAVQADILAAKERF